MGIIRNCSVVLSGNNTGTGNVSTTHGMADHNISTYKHTRRIEHEPGKQLKEIRHRTDLSICL